MAKEILLEWNTLVPGDVAKVAGVPGTFEFIKAVVDVDTQTVSHIEMVGGKKGYRKLRAFTPERVIIPSEKELQKQRKARESSDK